MNRRIGSVPCVLCNRYLEQREDKNGKPYFVCDECGIQLFVRGTNGIERLARLQSRLRAAPSKASTKDLEAELDCLQVHIEEYCADELVLPPGSSRIEDALPFVDWSRRVYERVRGELYKGAKGR
jgi:hypothetical protein